MKVSDKNNCPRCNSDDYLVDNVRASIDKSTFMIDVDCLNCGAKLEVRVYRAYIDLIE